MSYFYFINLVEEGSSTIALCTFQNDSTRLWNKAPLYIKTSPSLYTAKKEIRKFVLTTNLIHFIFFDFKFFQFIHSQHAIKSVYFCHKGTYSFHNMQISIFIIKVFCYLRLFENKPFYYNYYYLQ